MCNLFRHHLLEDQKIGSPHSIVLSEVLPVLALMCVCQIGIRSSDAIVGYWIPNTLYPKPLNPCLLSAFRDV